MIVMTEARRQNAVGVVSRCRRNYMCEGRQLGSLLGKVKGWLCVWREAK